MNCKPGQLAYVVNGTPRANLGRIVRTIETINLRCSCGGQVWIVEGNLEPVNPLAGFLAGLLGLDRAIADCCLRPIDNPPEDAVDEVLRKVGAPEGLVGMPKEEVHD